MSKRGKLAVLFLVSASTLLASSCGWLHGFILHASEFIQTGAALRVLGAATLT